MKLALIGTHGVGKTTLAYEICSLLKKSGYNVELVTEVARQSPFPVNAATTLEGQLWILHAQIVAELDAARRAPHVICDRAVLDNYCYLVNKFGRQPHLEPWLAWWMNSYSFLVGVPPVAFEIPSDGFRSEDRAFQQRIHDLLNELLAAPPFDNLRASVLWLEPSERRFWAKRIFAAALPLLPRRHCAHQWTLTKSYERYRRRWILEKSVVKKLWNTRLRSWTNFLFWIHWTWSSCPWRSRKQAS
jgi:hypothetical protein